MLSKNHLHDRAGNLRILSSLICSFAQIAQIKWVTVSYSLRSLRTNEQLWANCSGHSCQKSDRERIAQVAHDKSANEGFAPKNLTKMIKSYFLVSFLYVKKNRVNRSFPPKKATWVRVNIIKIWFIIKVNMKFFFEVLRPNNIAAKNGLSILNRFLHRAFQNNLHSFRFPTANFARVHENLLVSWFLNVDELA